MACKNDLRGTIDEHETCCILPHNPAGADKSEGRGAGSDLIGGSWNYRDFHDADVSTPVCDLGKVAK